MKHVDEARGRVSWNVLGYGVIVVAMAFGFWRIEHQADVENYLRCVEGNRARAAIVDGFEQFTDALVAASESGDDGDSPEEEARDRGQIEAFRADVGKRLAPLKPSDCGPRP